MAKLKPLDWLAQQIIAVFEDQDFDAAYIEDKKNTLAGLDRLSVLLWCNNLDAERKEELAKRLNINADDLTTTLKTLQRI
jgi:hypothetical protein